MNFYLKRMATFAVYLFSLCSFCSADLVAHFPLDNDAVDVASGFEGNVPDSVTFNDNGVFGGAAEFEGFEGIDVEWAEELNPESFSVSAWVQPFDTTSWNSVITSRGHVEDPIIVTGYILYNTPEEAWDFWVGTGGPSGAWGRSIGPLSELDEWQHLAITYDGDSDTKTLYVNGIEEASDTGQGYEPNPQFPLHIGSGGDVGAEFYFVGLIDDLGIWNEPLDEAAVNRVMSDGVAAWAGGGADLGDFNSDGQIDAIDINALTNEILTGGNGGIFDVNNDAAVDGADRTFWVEEIKNTWLGDANLDGEFNSSDLVTVFQAGQYEDATPLNSTWETGDWNGDGDFGSSDFVVAFQGGGFEVGPRGAATESVPEPSGLGFVVLCLSGIACAIRKRRAKI